MKFDALDLKIIRMLQKDARKPFADIARELDVPQGIVQARFKRLKESGVIMGSTLILNLPKFGYKYFSSIGVNVAQSEIEEVAKYINGLKIKNALITSWTTIGCYNIATLIYLKDFTDSYKIKQLIRRHPAVLDVAVSFTEDLQFDYSRVNLEKVIMG